MLLLLKKIYLKTEKEIKNLLVHFDDVDRLELGSINWNMRFTRNNKTYKMLISICSLIVDGYLQSNNDGNKQMMDFIDEQHMSRLYEKFLFEYFKKSFLN